MPSPIDLLSKMLFTRMPVRMKSGLSPWLVCLATTIVALTSMAAIYRLNHLAEHKSQLRFLLTQTKEQMSRTNALEWEGISKGEIDEDLAEELAENKKRTDEILNRLREIQAFDRQGSLTTMLEVYEEYRTEIDDVLTLVQGGEIREAIDVDADGIDEIYDEMYSQIEVLEEAYIVQQALARRLANVGIAFSLLLAAAMISIFAHQFNRKVLDKHQKLKSALMDLKQAQNRLVQQEKIVGLGQVTAGVAHEINNPVNFIHGNLGYVQGHTQDLLKLVQLYQQHYPNPMAEIKTELAEIDLEFIQEDLNKILSSMQSGTDRIREIVLSLRNFSRMDEAECKAVDIHEGIDSTLLILQHRLNAQGDRPGIQVIKDYATLPLVECSARQINQAFMNILSNAIDALEEKNEQRTDQEIKEKPSQINIQTSSSDSQWVKILISDNGVGIHESLCQYIFDPFFTTKAVGKGTGLGMSISYQIITEQHQGTLEFYSRPDEGANIIIQLPVQQKACHMF
ncbi:hypothetical protein IQ267_27210 [filamentous cyanobacterium LEGE 07170]|nr:hypothetical protein [filamentous cyanobacterium LEGE 07170]